MYSTTNINLTLNNNMMYISNYLNNTLSSSWAKVATSTLFGGSIAANMIRFSK